MEAINKIVFVISTLVLCNMLFQIGYAHLGVRNEFIDDVLSFVGNFNFATMIVFPVVLLLYSIVMLFVNGKYKFSLLGINLLTCVLFFVG